MTFSFKETFYPLSEEEHKKIAQLIFEEAVKEKNCIACAFYNYDASVPGFVEYQGDCEKSHVPFFGNHPDGICKDWKLNKEKDTYYRDEK